MVRLKQKDKANEELRKLRVKIDRIDKNIIKQLHKRWTIAQKMKKLKKRFGIKIVEDTRVRDMKLKHGTAAKKFIVPEDVIQKVFSVIIRESLKHQKGKTIKKRNIKVRK